jgi:hypothetical protein
MGTVLINIVTTNGENVANENEYKNDNDENITHSTGM